MMNKNRHQTRRSSGAEPPRFIERMYNRTMPRSIENLPFLGTTWYTRGPAYWFRRVLASMLMLLGLFAATAITVGLTAAIAQSKVGIGVKISSLLVIALAIAYSFVRAFAAFFRVERLRRHDRIFRPSFDSQRELAKSRRYGAIGGVLAVAIRAGSLLAGALLVISGIFCFGWFVVLFIWSLQREYGVEHDARLRLEQQSARSGV